MMPTDVDLDLLRILVREVLLHEASDPKKGRGRKPAGSDRRLYTDEDPDDTVRVKFSSASAIKDTLAKKTFKAKSHARQSQIINLIHQRPCPCKPTYVEPECLTYNPNGAESPR